MLEAVNCFHKKAPSYMFQGVLVMPRKLYLFRAMEIKLPEDTEAEVHKCSSK